MGRDGNNKLVLNYLLTLTGQLDTEYLTSSSCFGEQEGEGGRGSKRQANIMTMYKPLDRLLTLLLPLLLLLCHVFTPSPPLLSAVGHTPNVLVNWGYFGVVFKNILGTFGLYFVVVLWLVWCFLDF